MRDFLTSIQLGSLNIVLNYNNQYTIPWTLVTLYQQTLQNSHG